MAVQAILAHRRMFPQEWPALLGMTLVTSIIHGSRFQKRFTVAAMRIVARAARHLALTDRHVRGLPDVRTLLLVTLKTNIRLCELCQRKLRRHIAHNCVTFLAGAAAHPMDA